MAQYHITPNGTIGRCTAQPGNCPYNTFHGETPEDLQSKVDTINDNYARLNAEIEEAGQEIRLAGEIFHDGRDSSYEYKRFLDYYRKRKALDTNNLNVLSDNTKVGKLFSSKDVYLAEIIMQERKKRLEGGGDRSVTYDEFYDLVDKNQKNTFDFVRYKSGNTVADNLARNPRISCEYAGITYNLNNDKKLNSIYSTHALSYGNSANYTDRFDKVSARESTSKLLKNYTKDSGVGAAAIFRSKEDPELLLVHLSPNLYDDNEGGLNHRVAFFTTEEQLRKDIG